MTRSVELGELRSAMTGPVFDPTSPDYDEVRKIWNADHDLRPAVVARCASAADVAAAVRFAREQGLEIAVRGGAHSFPGLSSVDDGLVIDLSPLDEVSVDAPRRRATVGGGALLADVDSATQEHGLALPTGIVSHTGIGGLALGGGLGWLTRLGGLTSDNLLSAQVVTADGHVVRASEDENSELYWALRGGGGNFGVVTRFEFRLHEVGPTIHFGLLFWGLEQGAEVLRLAQRLNGNLPRDLYIMPGGVHAPPEEFVPEQYRLQPGYVLMIAGFGGEEEHAELVAQVCEELPPLFEFVTPMPYTALQQLFDEAAGWGQYNYEKSLYLENLTEDAISVIVERLPHKSSPLSFVLMYRLDEEYCALGERETAFGGGRSARYGFFIIATSATPELFVADRAWAREFFEAIRPLSMGDATYVNALAVDDLDRMRASYGEAKLERLARIKAQYDPGNIFHRNVNIKPL
ncbi:FAD-binding oxidoreductase [Pseudonocardia sp. NPDC049154]|uniref:FAD-binding oxidoreductase n=1 Tax=Pseudonocardia sp. NPDC049154 TaxID=3155501 RepID=UPI00340364BD